MQETWRDYLDYGDALASPSLFNPEARDRILDVAANFPATSGMGLEIRLWDGADQTDIAVRVKKGEASGFTTASQSSLVSQDIFDDASDVWLECDAPFDDPTTRSLYFKPDVSADRSDLLTRLRRGVALVRDTEMSEAEAREIADLIASMPPGIELHYCGIPGSGRGTKLRFVFACASLVALEDWLDQRGRNLDLARLEAIIRLSSIDAPHFANVPIRFNWCHDYGFADGAGPMSLEIAPPPSGADDAWRALLTRLADVGAIGPTKVDDLLAWPGDRAFLLSGSYRYLGRRLNHIKMTMQTTGEISVKGYLYCAAVANVESWK